MNPIRLPMMLLSGITGLSAYAQCPVNQVLLNTGYDHINSNVLPFGATDPRWKVVYDPPAVSTGVPRQATVIQSFNPPWANPEPGSRWISGFSSSSQNENGDYLFETTFCLLPGVDLSTATLDFGMRGDDFCTAFVNPASYDDIINNLATPFHTGDPFNQPALTFTSYFLGSIGATVGKNFLVIRVRNTGGGLMGLDLVATVNASPNGTANGPACCNPYCSIQGLKFSDFDNDGIRDAGEPGLPGWTINLQGPGGSQTAITDTFGYYNFTGLAAGTYTITETLKSCWVQTAPPSGSYTETLVPNQSINGRNFGNWWGLAPGPCLIEHDGTSEAGVGTNNPNHEVLWMQSQGDIGGTTVVKSISTAWGTPPVIPLDGPPAGTAARVGIWSDPNQDGNPSDAVLLRVASVVGGVANPDTNMLQTQTLSPSVLVTGRYFIGASCAGGRFPAPLDTDSVPCDGTVWIVTSTVGPMNYNDINHEEIPPIDENTILPGFWLLEANCKDIEITPMCFGDGTDLPCPCGSPSGSATNGCTNSVAGSVGAHLAGSGNPIISADTLTVTATGVRKGNPTLAQFFSGSEVSSHPVNDGLLCAGSPICRLWNWVIPGPGGGFITLTGPGATTTPNTSGISISQRSANLGRPILNGETRIFTVWYRDPANYACPSPAVSNYTNGLRVLWSQ